MPRPNRGTRLSDQPNSHGVYEITWSDGGRTRRLSTGARTRAAAEKALAAFIMERDAAPPRPDDATVSAIVAAYEAEHITKRAVDAERALYCGKPIVAFFGAMLPAEINDAAVNAYGDSRRPRSEATIRRELQHLIAALNHAHRNRRIADVPHIPLPGKVEPRSLVLTEAEIARLMAACPPVRKGRERQGGQLRLSRTYRFIAIMMHAPARPTAIQTLTWDRVDLEKRVINFREAGRKVTKKKRVAVPISDALLPILQRAREEATNEWVLDEPGKVRRGFEAAVQRAGLTADVTPYTLRHSWGTHAISRGISPALVAALMGDTLDTIMRNYVHTQPDHLRGAVDIWSATHG